jgi:hypothetical protein
MAAEFDGWAIARQRIAKESRERTSKLDLRGLELEKIASEIAGLTHLRELDLGSRMYEGVSGQFFDSRDDMERIQSQQSGYDMKWLSNRTSSTWGPSRD